MHFLIYSERLWGRTLLNIENLKILTFIKDSKVWFLSNQSCGGRLNSVLSPVKKPLEICDGLVVSRMKHHLT